MKIKNWWIQFDNGGELVASFGEARLVKGLTGKAKLVRGSNKDRIAAREWISMFWQDEPVREVP